MFFYMIHHLNHYWLPNENKTDGQKNAATFMIGGILWWIFFAFVSSQGPSPNVVFVALQSWFLWLVGIDMVTMAILYRTYYNRSIGHEMRWSEELVVKDEKKEEKKEKDIEKTEKDVVAVDQPSDSSEDQL